MQGRVKWFNDKRGYGFIDSELNEDIMVHFSEIVSKGFKTLKSGEKVSFELIKTSRGYMAKNVVKILN